MKSLEMQMRFILSLEIQEILLTRFYNCWRKLWITSVMIYNCQIIIKFQWIVSNFMWRVMWHFFCPQPDAIVGKVLAYFNCRMYVATLVFALADRLNPFLAGDWLLLAVTVCKKAINNSKSLLTCTYGFQQRHMIRVTYDHMDIKYICFHCNDVIHDSYTRNYLYS